MELCIKDAFRLWKVIRPHLPESYDTNAPAVSFLHSIVNHMLETSPADYAKTLEILSGQTTEELAQKNVQELLEIFIKGLSENQVMILDEFCERIGMQ